MPTAYLSLELQRKWKINIFLSKPTAQETPKKRRKIRPNKTTRSLNMYVRENPLIAYAIYNKLEPNSIHIKGCAIKPARKIYKLCSDARIA